MLIDVYAAEFHYEKALGICYRQRSKKQCFDEPESGDPGSSGKRQRENCPCGHDSRLLEPAQGIR